MSETLIFGRILSSSKPSKQPNAETLSYGKMYCYTYWVHEKDIQEYLSLKLSQFEEKQI